MCRLCVAFGGIGRSRLLSDNAQALRSRDVVDGDVTLLTVFSVDAVSPDGLQHDVGGGVEGGQADPGLEPLTALLAHAAPHRSPKLALGLGQGIIDNLMLYTNWNLIPASESIN